MNVGIHHVSVLVTDVLKNSAQFKRAGYAVGDVERFDSEGTEETYIGGTDKNSRLLLQAPLESGPYRRAYEKRGVGLHHIALEVDDLNGFTDFMGRIGWLLHVISLKNHSRNGAIYFARPGVHVLFEVEELAPSPGGHFIKKISVPVADGHGRFIQAMDIPALEPALTGGFSFGIDDGIWTTGDFT